MIGKVTFWSEWLFEGKSPILKGWGFQQYAWSSGIPNISKKVICLLGKNYVPLGQNAKSSGCSLRGRHRIKLSTTLNIRGAKWVTLLYKDALEGVHVVDYEGSHASPQVQGLWTLQGQLLMCTCSMVKVLMEHSPCGYHAMRELVGHYLRGHVVLLGHASLNKIELRVFSCWTC